MSDSAPPPPPPPPAGDPYSAGTQAGEQAGELLPRFVARLIDLVILAIVNGIIGSLIGVGAFNATGGGDDGVAIGAIIAAAVVGAVISLGYFTLMESTQGRTVGKMAMKLRTVGPGGGNPTTAEAAKRNIYMGLGILGIIPGLGSLLGSLLALVSYILCAVGINSDLPSRQHWFDKFAGGTRVVKAG